VQQKQALTAGYESDALDGSVHLNRVKFHTIDTTHWRPQEARHLKNMKKSALHFPCNAHFRWRDRSLQDVA
jgi:hypothetical protein